LKSLHPFIALGATATVTGITLRADNDDDDDLIQYWNATDNWQDFVTIHARHALARQRGPASTA
jgi:hypothetical protein